MARGRVDRLVVLADEIAEVGDGVFGVAHQLRLRLRAVELLAVDVRQDRGDLPVAFLVGNHLDLALARDVRDRAVRVAKRQPDRVVFARRAGRRRPIRFVTHDGRGGSQRLWN